MRTESGLGTKVPAQKWASKLKERSPVEKGKWGRNKDLRDEGNPKVVRKGG